jgi:formylmethanofuran dehydrogenase subunit E
LGETDAFMPPPSIDFSLTVRCDECGEEFAYDPAELLRFQMGQQPNFKPHPLFL